MKGRFRVIDISQPVSSATACFPGDVPFRRDLTLRLEESGVINLSSFTMSPHVGTHADAPGHVRGSMTDAPALAGALPLEPYIGPAVVVDIAPCRGPIAVGQVGPQLDRFPDPLERVLIRTQTKVRPEVFEDEYASLSEPLVAWLRGRGTVLVGLDAPSVDPVRSKELPAHHALLHHGMRWLENLDLGAAPAGRSFLVALPLKVMELEASPVRAVLLIEAG